MKHWATEGGALGKRGWSIGQERMEHWTREGAALGNSSSGEGHSSVDPHLLKALGSLMCKKPCELLLGQKAPCDLICQMHCGVPLRPTL